eukprot:7204129-Prymnesium_polylepis.2
MQLTRIERVAHVTPRRSRAHQLQYSPLSEYICASVSPPRKTRIARAEQPSFTVCSAHGAGRLGRSVPGASRGRRAVARSPWRAALAGSSGPPRR